MSSYQPDETERITKRPHGPQGNVPKVVVPDDRPSSPGVWQNGVPPPGYVPKPVRDQ